MSGFVGAPLTRPERLSRWRRGSLVSRFFCLRAVSTPSGGGALVDRNRSSRGLLPSHHAAPPTTRRWGLSARSLSTSTPSEALLAAQRLCGPRTSRALPTPCPCGGRQRPRRCVWSTGVRRGAGSARPCGGAATAGGRRGARRVGRRGGDRPNGCCSAAAASGRGRSGCRRPGWSGQTAKTLANWSSFRPPHAPVRGPCAGKRVLCGRAATAGAGRATRPSCHHNGSDRDGAAQSAALRRWEENLPPAPPPPHTTSRPSSPPRAKNATTVGVCRWTRWRVVLIRR